MMVTALSPIIGYDRASEIAHHAVNHDLPLKDAAIAKGVPEDVYDAVVLPLAMTQPTQPTGPSAATQPPRPDA
jgi:fumarate hydratase class II